MNPGQAAAGVFTQPGKTFEALVARPTWWLPFVLLIAAVAASILVATPKIDQDQTVREAFEKRAEKTGAKVPEEQVQRAVEQPSSSSVSPASSSARRRRSAGSCRTAGCSPSTATRTCRTSARP